MVDRILNIGYKLSGSYNKELLQRAAEVYIYKGPAAVIPHLINNEKLEPEKAAQLFREIDREMHNVNRQVLLQYGVFAIIFLVLVLAGYFSRSYIFAALFALPLLRVVYSSIRFIRRNPLR